MHSGHSADFFCGDLLSPRIRVCRIKAVRGLRCVLSPRPPARRGSRSSRDSSPPTARPAYGGQRGPRNAAAAGRVLQNHMTPLLRAPHKNGIRPLQRKRPLPREVAALSRPPLMPDRNRPRRNAPAAFESNTSSRTALVVDCLPDAARSGPRRTRHRGA